MRILFLTQWFTPEPFFKGLEYVKKLSHLGHVVFVLTAYPNYPNGKIYEGYKIRPFEEEEIEGIPILRTAIYPSHNTSPWLRILNYLSFALSATLFGLFKIPKIDIVYAYHPPATISLPGLVLKFFRRIPCVYEIQDLWPDTLRATGIIKSHFLLKLCDLWCRFIYRFVDKIIVISPGFKEKLIARNVCPDKIEVIYNCCDEKNIYSRPRNKCLSDELKLTGKFNIMFAGNMGRAQSLSSVLDAASLISKEYPQIQFVFIGGGVDVSLLKQYAKDRSLRNTLFLPGVSSYDIGDVLALADAMIVHLKDDPLFTITIPGKIQAYMAAGKPIILGVRGDAADLMNMSKAGILCKPEDPRDIARAVKEIYKMSPDMLDRMGKNAMQFYKNEFSADVGLKKLDAVFTSAISARNFGSMYNGSENQ